MECNQEPTEKIGLDIFCTEANIESIKLIQSKIFCATQACSIGAIPEGSNPEIVKIFVQTAIESLSSYRFLEGEWWDLMKKTFELPRDKDVWIDFETKEFYLADSEEQSCSCIK